MLALLQAAAEAAPEYVTGARWSDIILGFVVMFVVVSFLFRGWFFKLLGLLGLGAFLTRK